ncbi:hypothetical protein CRM22_005816 [Opisthorchis felineus]|uniref:Protein DGCR6 n=1 Tax=Opisthorchis felineus TaxID=147828 RepID=A0A4S2LVC9_OPIFE|nr:hypothetical protein CRM22_005816 [Opisthorchis felineus]
MVFDVLEIPLSTIPQHPLPHQLGSPKHHVRIEAPMNVRERELFQQRVYFYLNELRTLFAEAPIDIQAGISEAALTQLAHTLADGAIFDSVIELSEAQRSEEHALHKQLMSLRSEQSAERTALRNKHREERAINASRQHHLPILQKEQEQELQRLTKRQMDSMRSLTTHIVHSLDGRVMEQQSALEQIGCPLFIRTTNPHQIRIQMRVLDWIMRLSHRPLPTELRTPSVPNKWPP